MKHVDVEQQLWRCFADLLEYPTPAVARQAQACVEAAAAVNPEAAALLGGFCAFAQDTPLARLEELYTRTFDLQVICYPYVGYHLFGESYKRGAFLARLNEAYRMRGFTAGRELPDHLAVILRFLALDDGSETPAGADEAFAQPLLAEGVVPAVDKMAAAFDANGDNPYGQVVGALRLALSNGKE